MVALTQLPQGHDRERVLVTREGQLLLCRGNEPLRDGLTGECLAQASDPCDVETLDTGASLWCWCVRHDWFRRLPQGSAPVGCPHEGR
jgi:hypothetical protein